MMSVGSAHWLLKGGGGVDMAALRDRMFGYLFFDTAYELALPFVKGQALNTSFVVHHVVGVAAHSVARRHPSSPMAATFAPYVYLAEFSTVFLHLSWMCNLLGKTDTALFTINGSLGAAAYLAFRVFLPPVTFYQLIIQERRDPPWVDRFFLATHAAFVALNLFWLPELLAMIRRKMFPPRVVAPAKKKKTR
mmetsp:Transcript_20297/g.65388  ORF Transcript_20297/g.65388 Transcript_20297/m.65388 type:complete len:192 (-) Transcript_20297:72-647(-)